MPALPAPRLDRLPAIDDEGRHRAVIEACQGSRNKLKYQTALQAFELHAVLRLGTSFPYDFGFIPSTRGDDGDPLDVLVFADEAMPPGTVAPCRLVGVIEGEQQNEGERAERNDRLLAVAEPSHRYGECRELRDIAAAALEEIEHFFIVYNAHKGGRFTPLARRGAAAASRLAERGRRRYASER